MADAAKEEPAKDEPSGFLKFWTTLPGVLTGIAAVVAAVVSLIALFHHDAPTAAPATQPPVVASPVVPAEASGPTSASASGPTTSGTDQVAGRGSLTVGVGEHVDLAAGLVSDSASANRHDPQFFLSDADGYALAADGAQALVAIDGTADRAGCLAAVTSRQAGRLALTAAVRTKTICVLTDGQQVAALTPIALPAVGSPRFAFDYVLWS